MDPDVACWDSSRGAGNFDVRERWGVAIAVSAAAFGLGWDIAHATDPRTAEQEAKARFTPPTGFLAVNTVHPADLSEPPPARPGAG